MRSGVLKRLCLHSAMHLSVLGLVFVSSTFPAFAQTSPAASSGSDTGGVVLTNLDEDAAPEAAEKPAAEAAGAKLSDKAASAKETVPKKQKEEVDPRQQHRDLMLQQAQPENYMNSNPAVSRRYLKVDKATFEEQLQPQPSN